MATPSSNAEASQEVFTKAQRIQQLNDIDKKLHELLRSAGLALQTLSENKCEDVTAASNTYLRGLSAIDVGLRRQIYGLEEADIIAAEKKKRTIPEEDKKKAGLPGASSTDTSNEGGMGKLDIGWLNSNSGQVDRDMEAELWTKARKLLEAQGLGKGNDGQEDTEMAT